MTISAILSISLFTGCNSPESTSETFMGGIINKDISKMNSSASKELAGAQLVKMTDCVGYALAEENSRSKYDAIEKEMLAASEEMGKKLLENFREEKDMDEAEFQAWIKARRDEAMKEVTVFQDKHGASVAKGIMKEYYDFKEQYEYSNERKFMAFFIKTKLLEQASPEVITECTAKIYRTSNIVSFEVKEAKYSNDKKMAGTDIKLVNDKGEIKFAFIGMQKDEERGWVVTESDLYGANKIIRNNRGIVPKNL